MFSPSEKDPIAQTFKCNKCDDKFWSISPSLPFKRPSREIEGQLENLQSQAQCPLCKESNIIYWYRPYSPS